MTTDEEIMLTAFRQWFEQGDAQGALDGVPRGQVAWTAFQAGVQWARAHRQVFPNHGILRSEQAPAPFFAPPPAIFVPEPMPAFEPPPNYEPPAIYSSGSGGDYSGAGASGSWDSSSSDSGSSTASSE